MDLIVSISLSAPEFAGALGPARGGGTSASPDRQRGRPDLAMCPEGTRIAGSQATAAACRTSSASERIFPPTHGCTAPVGVVSSPERDMMHTVSLFLVGTARSRGGPRTKSSSLFANCLRPAIR